MFKKVKTNECRVIVEPRGAGDYGFMSIGGMSRTPQEEYQLCSEIESEINRHVDNVGSVTVEQVEIYVDEEHGEADRLSDLLEARFAEVSLDYWKVRYKYKEDGDFHSCSVYDFRDVIEQAWKTPYGFEAKSMNGIELRQDQIELLDKIMKASIEHRENQK